MERNEKQDRVVPLTKMRKIIAKRMHESLSLTAQFTLTREINVDKLLAFLEKQKSNPKGHRVKLMHIIVRITDSPS